MSATTLPPLAERIDIHKSCKSIEILLNILNEYCEAAGAVVTLQKKLAKALRDTAGLKVTGEIAANAMHASANIYEALSDVDFKFAKIADKEYEVVSSDVKKWFKKLAKEERAHDERMTTVNAKIKQAGQIYEKKSKKKASDVTEEHTRYINLISTLGPEVTQEKYNHSFTVTQKHTTTTYGVASCLARLADAEWQKSCECIRRFSPTIGPLGEWRALCEGGWTGSIPQDLPDDDVSKGQLLPAMENIPGLGTIQEDVKQQQQGSLQPSPIPRTPEAHRSTDNIQLPPPGSATPEISTDPPSRDNQVSAHDSPTPQRQNHPAAPPSAMEPGLLLPPSTPHLEPLQPPFADPNTGSVRSLSDFPPPPTHFPLPPPRQLFSTLPQSQSSSTSNLDFPSSAPLAESPISVNEDGPGDSDFDDSISRSPHQPRHTQQDQHHGQQGRYSNQDSSNVVPMPSPLSPERRFQDQARNQDRENGCKTLASSAPSPLEVRRLVPVRSQTSLPAVEPDHHRTQELSSRQGRGHLPSSSVDRRPLIMKADSRDAYQDEGREFGVNTNNAAGMGKARTIEGVRSTKPLEMMDTGTSSGSLVAAMRNRYTNNSGSTSPPPPRELPRLPLNVNNLASRYQGGEPPLSPTKRTSSPPVSRQQSLPLLDTVARQSHDQGYRPRMPSLTNRATPSTPTQDDQRRRRQRDEEFAEADRRREEEELRERELELEMRARELDRDRARLQTLREGQTTSGTRGAYGDAGSPQSQTSESNFGLRPRERRVSLRHQLQRPLSQMELGDVGGSGGGPSNSGGGPPPGNTGSNLRLKVQHSHSATHLVLPASSSANTPPSTTQSPQPSPKLGHRQTTQPPSMDGPYDRRIGEDRYGDDIPSGANTNTSSSGASSLHAAYCGCESCSVVKYKSSPGSSPNTPSHPQNQTQNPHYQQPKYGPIESKAPKQEKSKPGWIRRLSMPVGNAFNLDSSRRHQSSNSVSSLASTTSNANANYALGSGISGGPGGRGIFSMDAAKNRSATVLRSSDVYEDGRLGITGGRQGGADGRSYEASGVSSRSATNLGIGARH